ncbi:EAL domain-containing protein [Marinomonas mediterranea]|jgi:FOG: EAL domain|uniref:Diguanylate cyclase/phosphodiesterase n=1 Tax=Marinomonas mediterranea (strain ATCC 700492 / JCM 21426 / NBRC 103028 / MMB-1) TaxID=717774 RepID=F2K445_MARM1|nr:EAL domain-containing protein [Marinomonas mediterranea]ADZ91387.1 diguanylate cyclase/phosphodiesterase [Marinomonas mediterranea MMB-1]WCN13437.1 EAL domain-containing protein [Marinomonas mediterranea]WCN17503.1 EAL domain-containing protein [Marinomonas mediterranea MMB-1]
MLKAKTFVYYLATLLFVAMFWSYNSSVHFSSMEDASDEWGAPLYLYDSASVEDIKRPRSDNWKTLNDNTARFGYRDGSVWLKFELPPIKGDDQFLLLDYPLLDHVTVLRSFSDGTSKRWETGDSKAFSSRYLPSEKFLFPIGSAKYQSELLIGVSSQGTLKIPLFITDRRGEVQRAIYANLLIGSYVGYMLLMLITSLIISVTTTEKRFVLCAIYVAFIGLLNLQLSGFLFQWVWPDMPRINGIFTLIVIYLSAFFQLAFVESYLSYSKGFFRKLSKIFKWLCATALFLALLPNSYSLLSQLGVVLLIIACILSVILTFINMRKTKHTEVSLNYFLCAWVVMLIGIVTSTLGVIGILPPTSVVNNASAMSSVLAVFFLLSALFDRYNQEHKEKFALTIKSLKASEERAKAERHLVFQATHDSLSDLPKKDVLFNNWPRIINDIPKDASLTAVIVHFEGYYDQVLAFGHQVADEMIKQLHFRAMKYAQNKRNFLVLDLDWTLKKVVVLDSHDLCLISMELDPVIESRMIKEMHQTLSDTMIVNGLSLEVDLTIGVCRYRTGDVVQNLIRRSQVASKEASERRIDSLRYSDKMGLDPEYSGRLLMKFKKALENDLLQVWFQPQINTDNGSLRGAEALLRWHDIEYGWISPELIIPFVEQSSLIGPLTDYVTRKSCEFVEEYERQLNSQIQIAINLSARNLEDEKLAHRIGAILVEYNVPENHVTLEVTETAFLGDSPQSKTTFAQLDALGVNIALDDFGTGYSSLSYLHELSFSEIKIDKSFLADLEHNQRSLSLVKVAINLGKELNMHVVAEGVETKLIEAKLKSIGCSICQGFYYGKPMSKELFLEWAFAFNNNGSIIE